MAATEQLEPDHPVAATILYRALLDDILDRARSPAYRHAARYLEKLDALSAYKDAPSTTLGGFFALAMGPRVCCARMAVEQTTKSGAIFARLRYAAIILAV